MKIVTVHGTYARSWLHRKILSRPPWWYADSAFCQALCASVPECSFASFEWSGRNSHAARSAAGEQFAGVLHQLKAAAPHEPLCIVAHSHGGNVALKALDAAPAGLVHSVFLLGVPFMELHTAKPAPCNLYFEATRIPCGGTVRHYSFWGDAGSRVTNGIWNFYSLNDAVQVFWASVHTGFPLLQRLRLPGKLVVTRVFSPPRAHRLTNVPVDLQTRTRMGVVPRLLHLDAIFDHDALSSAAIGKMVGQFLAAGEPRLAREQGRESAPPDLRKP